MVTVHIEDENFENRDNPEKMAQPCPETYSKDSF